MLDPNRPFYQARLKHIWASKHTSQLNALWDHFLESDFCHVEVKPDPNPLNQGSQAVYVVTNDLPPDLLLTIGDAIHNMKAALDFTISEIIGGRNTRVTFPFGESRKELISSFSTEGLPGCETCGRGGKGKGRNAAIEMAVGGIGDFIVQNIKPYKSANNPLWVLNKLDVRDKHRLLVPVLVPRTLPDLAMRDSNNNTYFLQVEGFAGTTVLLVRTGATKVEIQGYGKATADILFNEVGIIENQGVFPTLVNMAKAVGETIDSLEEFALANGWAKTNK